MTDVIAKLRALHEIATPAPWEDDHDGTAFIHRPSDGRPERLLTTRYADGNKRWNTRLIVAARNALPALLDAVELLRTIRATELHGSHVTLAAEIDAVLARLEETP